MKLTSSRILGLVLLAAFAVTLLFLLMRSQRGDSRRLSMSDRETRARSSIGNSSHVDREEGESSPPPSSRSEDEDQSANDTKLEMAVSAMNVRFDFWGKVVDQDEHPIAGARVVMHSRKWILTPGGPNTLSPKREAASSQNGSFEWTGVVGDYLRIESVTKEGYRLVPKNQLGFDYDMRRASFRPDPTNPAVIRMHKLLPPEKLIAFRRLFGFTPDGRSYTMDLLANKKYEEEKPEGDLFVTMTRPPIVAPREHYDWNLELRGVADCGLIEASSQDPGYIAPEAGYQQNVSIRFEAQDPAWTDMLTKAFFIRARGGRIYGFLNLTIWSDYNGTGAIFFETRLNPAGSRNLQP